MIASDRLAVFPWLSAMPEAWRTALSDRIAERVCADGEIIFYEGDPGDALYFVAEGHVAIQKILDPVKGTRKVLSLLEPGDFFGEMALLDQVPRWASAVAQGKTTLFCLSAREVRDWMGSDQTVPLHAVLPVLGALNGRLRQTGREMMTLFDVGGVLSQEFDPSLLGKELLRVLGRVFDEDIAGGVFLRNDSSREYERAALEGVWPLAADLPARPFSDPFFVWMGERGECALSADWASDERFSAAIRAAWPGFRSLLAAPILGGKRPAGFFVFLNDERTNYFTSSHRRVLAGVANLAASAFESAFIRVERRAQERLQRARLEKRDF